MVVVVVVVGERWTRLCGMETGGKVGKQCSGNWERMLKDEKSRGNKGKKENKGDIKGG